MNVRMDNGRSIDNVRVWKQNRTPIVTYKKYYEKWRCYFLYFDHIFQQNFNYNGEEIYYCVLFFILLMAAGGQTE